MTKAVQALGGARDARTVALFLAVASFVVMSAFGPTAATAHSYKLGDIAVGHVWAPPPEEGAGGLPVYGPILNRGGAPVRLVGASTPVAEQVRFRIEKEGEEHWREAIAFAPGKPFALAPWREHIWLSGLNRPLKDGDSFDLTLDFGDAGRLSVKVVVEKASGH